MNYSELFKHIKEMPKEEWITVGAKLDYKIEIDDALKIVRLIFQESNGFLDWVHNFIYFDVRYRDVYSNQVSCIKAHVGFAHLYKSGNDQIMDEFIKIINEHPDYVIEIVGWSQGGAVTQLAAEDLNFRTRTDKDNVDSGKKAHIIAYGSPKVFANDENTMNYIRSCCGSITEIAQHNDMVTYMPPFNRFCHIDPNFKRTGKATNLFFDWFKPKIYHTSYDDVTLYTEEQLSFVA